MASGPSGENRTWRPHGHCTKRRRWEVDSRTIRGRGLRRTVVTYSDTWAIGQAARSRSARVTLLTALEHRVAVRDIASRQRRAAAGRGLAVPVTAVTIDHGRRCRVGP